MIAQLQERLTIPEAMNAVGSVRAWQHILNGCGYQPMLVLNGHLDEATTSSTKKFQQDVGLDVTEKIDIKTWQAGLKHKKGDWWGPDVPPEVTNRPAPSSMSEPEKYKYYRAIIEANGGKFKTGGNKQNLLGLRKETNVHANNGRGLYDDFLVMLWVTSSGQLRVREYPHFCTEPIRHYKDTGGNKRWGDRHKPVNQIKPAIGHDANGDGIKDLGRIPEGYYEYKTRLTKDVDLGWVLDPMQDMYSVRDTNDDGIFSAHERRTSAGRSILFHQGGNLEQGGHTWSAGCQTLRKDNFDIFWKDLHSEGNPGVIGYTLVRKN
jgi:hypothetical protein